MIPKNNFLLIPTLVLITALVIMTTTKSSDGILEKSPPNMLFYLNIGSPQYAQDLQLFESNLKSGDYLFIHGSSSQLPAILKQIQTSSPKFQQGVNLEPTIGYDTISNLTKDVPSLPKGYSVIFYDYEPGFSPEFTSNEATSIIYFDEAEAAVHQYNINTGSNAQLLVTPPYGSLTNWDWGLAAKHMNLIDIQMGSYTRSTSLASHASTAISAVKQEAPDTNPAFVQLSMMITQNTPQIISDDIYTNQGVGVNQVLPYYNQTNGYTTLQQLFSSLHR